MCETNGQIQVLSLMEKAEIQNRQGGHESRSYSKCSLKRNFILDGTPQTLLHGQEENFYEKDGTVSEGNSMSKGYSENKVVLVNVPEKPATFAILPRMI